MTARLTPQRVGAAVYPKKWSAYQGRDRDAELRSLKRRFAAIRNRFDRAKWVRTIRRMSLMPLAISLIVFVGISGVLYFSPFAPMETIKHVASMPNCASSRALGVAPALRGQPGYWPWHDADDDGIACERWRKR